MATKELSDLTPAATIEDDDLFLVRVAGSPDEDQSVKWSVLVDEGIDPAIEDYAAPKAGNAAQTFAVDDAAADTHAVNRQTGDARFAALAGNASQVFATGNATGDTHAVNRQTGDGRFAKLAGLSTQTFSVANASSGAHAVNRTYGDARYGVYESGATASPGGAITGGTIRWARVGKKVTISWTDLTHSSASTVQPAAGVIPSAFRPSETQSGVWIHDANSIDVAAVNSGGTMTFVYRTWAGSLYNRTAVKSGSISFRQA